MTRKCSVCEHDDLAEIEYALASNEALRTIADRWSVSKTDLMRHRNQHLPASVIEEAREAEEAGNANEEDGTANEEDAPADKLLGQVCDLQKRTLTIFEEAEEAEELSVALQAIMEAKGNVERSVKLLGEVTEHP